MAAKLIDLKEAAELLGVTPEQLGEMRQRGEIHGYRDGGSWKFKSDEIERVQAEQGGTISDPFAADDLVFKDTEGLTQHDLTIFKKPGEQPIEPLDGMDDDSILVSEEALGHSAESTSSTVIGKGKKGESAADSDIQLASEPRDPSVGSDVALVADSGIGSDVKLVAGGSDVLKSGGSDITKSSGSDVHSGGSGKKASPSDTGKLGGSDLSLDDDPLEISMGSSLTLGDDEEKPIQSPAAGSSVMLGGDDDDDLVLGGSSAGSDLTLGAGGSGINLTPTDSGLNLEQPLDLGGSAVESLELPEDDDMISLEEAGDPEAATQLKADDEFLLTPVEEAFGDDDSSGSQVIALEDSEAYADENARTMLGGQAAAQQGLAAAAADPFAAGLDQMIGPGGQVSPAMTAQPMMAQAPAPMAPAGLPEAPYSIWNVMSLMFIVLFLGMTGMLMTDVVRNIWSFEGTYPATTQMMDWWVEVFKLEP